MPGGTLSKLQIRSFWIEGLLLAFVFAAIWLPRGLALDQFVTTDEPKWAYRSANFYYALRKGKFADTYQREHPGVITMWAGTAGLVWLFPEYAKFSGTGESTFWLYQGTLQAHDHETMDLLAAGRFFMVFINTITLTLAFVYAKRLIGTAPALIGFFLIAFDPFHIAHTHLLHLDGASGCLMFLSLLAFLSHLYGNRHRDLIVSGIAAGLSFLTKSPSTFLVPVIGLLIIFDLWQKLKSQKIKPATHEIKQSLWTLITWGVVALLVFTVLWPAMWVDPVGAIVQMTEAAFSYSLEGHTTQWFFNGEILGNGNDRNLGHFYPITYLWRSTPIVLIGLLLALLSFFAKTKPLDDLKTRYTMVACILFIIIFTLLMSLGAKKFDRYLIPVYAPIDMIAGLGWVATVYWTRERFSHRVMPQLTLVALGLVIILQSVGTIRVFPYYLSYYNPLMGGSRKASEIMQIGWGEGLDQAGRYLNQKPNADELFVASWYLHSFSYSSFSGEYIGISSQMNDGEYRELYTTDYLVIYIHQWQRQLPKPLLDRLSQLEPEHSIWINGLEYIRIYRLSDDPTNSMSINTKLASSE